MADWTNLPNQAVGVGGLPSGTTVTALRDNPIAIAEGAAGAPRVDPIAAMEHQGQAGAVGTYAFAWRDSTATPPPFGGTVAGSQLRPAGFTSVGGVGVSVGATTFGSGSDIQGSAGSDRATLNGTWRCMGEARQVGTTAGNYPHTLWLRIS